MNRKYNAKREGLQDASVHPKLLQINVTLQRHGYFAKKFPPTSERRSNHYHCTREVPRIQHQSRSYNPYKRRQRSLIQQRQLRQHNSTCFTSRRPLRSRDWTTTV